MFWGCKYLRSGVVIAYVQGMEVLTFGGCKSLRSGVVYPSFGGC